MKKILGIFAASAAALGSAMISATPVRAQSAILPVEIEVTPSVFLRTYSQLNFVVSQQDLQGGRSIDQDAGIYDENLGSSALSTDAPNETGTGTVTKTIPRLYQIWGNSAADVEITATQETLTDTNGVSGGGLTGGGTGDTVTMIVSNITEQQVEGKAYRDGEGTFDFTFSNLNATQDTRYTGGEITIRVVNP
ncbi:hypothetical protein Riv7116_1393 [Rivularia sp. PCC 7116]|uniref:hypothetical protein n=1 Tax=Rivularia sp. PCC 7116 TaxID=373994 RepID=UPI00029F1AE7|nr:hypothetical protein [Rivularia sp. PCC 7116]AFY53957.1 hypothetical protein Riv7116_1393 [Rivularia sp. PCC 7116]